MDKCIKLLILVAVLSGCETINLRSGMTEWDYKALKDGYVMECRCCEDTPSCKWVLPEETQ